MSIDPPPKHHRTRKTLDSLRNNNLVSPRMQKPIRPTMIKYCVSALLSVECCPPFTLLLLNGPALPTVVGALLAREPKIICADGAADLLRRDWPGVIPDYVVGDLDSISPETKEWFHSRGTVVVVDEDQDRCDFEKAMVVAEELGRQVVVAGGGGADLTRFDQLMGNMNGLYCAAEKGMKVYWLGDRGWASVLQRGKHAIWANPAREGDLCALIPVGGKVKQVTSRGLKWDVDGEMRFGVGGLISTSNQIVQPVVQIDTSDPILWWCEVNLLSYL